MINLNTSLILFFLTTATSFCQQIPFATLSNCQSDFSNWDKLGNISSEFIKRKKIKSMKIKQIVYLEEGKTYTDYVLKRSYNKNGLITESYVYNFNNGLYSKKTFTYDEQSRLIEVICQGSGRSFNDTGYVKSDQVEHLARYTRFNKRFYSYNTKGKLLFVEKYGEKKDYQHNFNNYFIDLYYRKKKKLSFDDVVFNSYQPKWGEPFERKITLIQVMGC